MNTNTIKVSGSIVIYHENKDTLQRVIKNFLAMQYEKELVIIDNSTNDTLRIFCESFKSVKYIFVGKNIGFGSAHNLGFSELSCKSDIHLVLNPDIYFESKEIEKFIKWLYEEKDISLAVPRVYFPDAKVQNTIRNIPTVATLLKRRLNIKGIFDEFIKKDEFDGVKFDGVCKIPFAHGCFFAMPSAVYEKLGGFDERYFMYMEDIDICIRAKSYGKTVIHGDFSIFHEYRKGSSKSLKLLWWHIVSAFKFFLKNKEK